MKVDFEMAANIIQCVWDKENLPDDWKKGILVKLPNKGEITCAGIWRGITLLCIPANIMAKIRISRLRDQVDAKLRREQAGFRQGRGTTEQTFTLQKQSLEWNASLYTCFFDYKKAFNKETKCSVKVEED